MKPDEAKPKLKETLTIAKYASDADAQADRPYEVVTIQASNGQVLSREVFNAHDHSGP